MSKLTLDIDSRHKAALMIDDKSYVLMNYDGSKKTKGNTLIGRSNEQFTLDFINNSVDYIFEGTPEKIKDEYQYWKDKIQCKMMNINEVKKKQNISMSLEEYRNKIAAGQNPIAQYEAALQADRDFMKGDVINTWVEEPEPIIKEYKTVPDKEVIPKKSLYEIIRLAKHYNGNIYRDHYLDRLDKTAKKLLVVLGIDTFKEYFPNQSILKSDKRKLISVFGLRKFLNKWPNYKFIQKGYDQLNEDDKELFWKLAEQDEINYADSIEK